MDQISPPVDVESIALLEATGSMKSGWSSRVLGVLLTGAGVGGRLLLAMLYLLFSSGMVLWNKHLMHQDRFPFASMIATGHMITGLICAGSLWLAWPELFPSATVVLRRQELAGLGQKSKGSSGTVLRHLLRFFPIGALGAGNLVLSNWAFRYNQVSELQMVKESNIVMVYVLSIIVGIEVLQWRNACLLVAVALCAALAVCGQPQMLMMGLAIQMVACICQSIQVVLTNFMMVEKVGKVDPLTMVLCTAPVMILVLLPVNIALWEPVMLTRMMLFWPQLMGSCLFAFGLQVLTAVAIRELSATGMTLISVIKDLAIVALAAFLLNEHLTHLQLCGFFGAIAGISAYSWMKLKRVS